MPSLKTVNFLILSCIAGSNQHTHNRDAQIGCGPESLKEKVVAIFVNSKPNSLILMNLLKDRLRTEYHVKDVIWNDGENICRPSLIALINDVASLADLAITGTGD